VGAAIDWVSPYSSVLAPIVGLCVLVLAHVVLCQVGRSLNYLVAFMIAFAVGLAAQVWFGAATVASTEPLDRPARLILSAFSYAALGYCYFTFVNLGTTSLRIRILRLMLAAPTAQLSDTDIARIYDSNEIIDRRLERLQAWKQLEVKNGRYVVIGVPAFLRLYRAIRVARRIIYGRGT
jgi:hypothetical protein